MVLVESVKSDIEKRRDDFPMLAQQMHGKPLVYLDSAATAMKPQVVIDKITDFYQNSYGTVHRAVYQLANKSTEEYNAVRDKIRDFLNAERSEEIIFTRGTTDSINLVASCFGKAFVEDGDEILISEMEHHSNIIPWQILCEEWGAVLKVIPINDDGEILFEEFRALLSSKTKIVAVAHVSNALGTVNPIKEIVASAHAAGALVLVDGAQSVPHMKVDVQDLGADFYAFSSHKAYGPTGVGVLYGKYELLEAMPPRDGGGDMIDTVSFTGTTFAKPPLKFEAGTPMIAQVLGMGAAIDYILDVGLDQIHDKEQALLRQATELLGQIEGLRIIGTAKEKSAVISFVVEGVHPLDIGTMLDLKGVAIRTGHHCAQPLMKRFNLSSTARASFSFYNSSADVELFYNSLKETLEFLR
ncbi:MAG: cysteine desulfurase/selenocysteine lyase [Chlamydiales bacterium]